MIKIKPITPQPFKDKSSLYFTAAILETVKEADDLFSETYSTWEHKPKFKQKVKRSSRRLTGSTLTSDKGSKKNPYPFVTKGTKVRYATMTANFAAKTTPGIIGSSQGAGGVLYVDKRRPRPGIEARDFEFEIRQEIEPFFEEIIEDAIKLIQEASGHVI